MSGTTVYAATGGGLSISTDSGANFTNKTTSNGLGHNSVRGVTVSGTTVYAATNNGLSISTNSGATFTNKTTSNGLGSNSLYAVALSGSTIYAATAGGLSISTDGGANFTNKTTSNGLGHNTVRGVTVSGTTVYAATTGGLSISVAGSPGPLTFSSGAFGTVNVNTSNPLTVTVTNTGGATATPTAITPAGDSTLTVTGGTCAVSTAISASGTCTVQLTWTPTVAGSLTGTTLTVAYSGGTNPSNALALTGCAGTCVPAADEGTPAPVLVTFTFTGADAFCTNGFGRAFVGAWLILPATDQCTRTGAGARADARLLGWSTNADFPVDVAQAQVDKHWGAIDEVINGWHMILIPAGMSTFITGPNTLYPIWSA